MFDPPGRAIEDEQARGVARLGRCLGDRVGRQVVVEVVDPETSLVHAGHGNARPVGPAGRIGLVRSA